MQEEGSNNLDVRRSFGSPVQKVLSKTHHRCTNSGVLEKGIARSLKEGRRKFEKREVGIKVVVGWSTQHGGVRRSGEAKLHVGI